MIDRKEFRADLFYRLTFFQSRFRLCASAWKTYRFWSGPSSSNSPAVTNKKLETISRDTMDALCRYDWPGNIRELQNVLERAVILSTGPVFEVPLSELGCRRGATGYKHVGYIGKD